MNGAIAEKPASEVRSDAYLDNLQRNYLRDIILSPVYDVAVETPLAELPRLGERLGRTVMLKREDLQDVRSFKIRGAYHKMHKFRALAAETGVICASAGNHAQGVALSARQLGLKATVVMPITTPEIKIVAVRALGATIILHGINFDDADLYARELSKNGGALYIPPFDDPDIIAGQGTVAMELLSQRPDLEAVFIPVGGGGLLAGMAVYLKSVSPGIRVIGVEPEDSACMKAALEADFPVTLDRAGIFADGVSVRRAGTECFKLARLFCDEIITVGSDEICAAIKDVFEDLRAIAEPAGALALAGLKRYSRASHGTGPSAAVLSGANINFDTLRYVSERCELGEGREAVFAVAIPERKGSFRHLCAVLGNRAITEFNYRCSRKDRAVIYIGISLKRGVDELHEVERLLGAEGYEFRNLSDDELAKLHVRHMIGGPACGTLAEEAYQFRFPEHPGALMKFLQALGDKVNITLFHYRNHGAAVGDVLAAFEREEGSGIAGYLDGLGYEYRLVSENSAFRAFLGSAGTVPGTFGRSAKVTHET